MNSRGTAPTVGPMSALVEPETSSNDRPPRDGLVRVWVPALEGDVAGIRLRDTDAGGTNTPTLFGHFAVFNRWTEIDSFWEGTFMERIAPGAFKKTFKENRDSMRCLFQHGRDAELGMKPLGAIDELREDGQGAFYEVPLFRSVPELLLDGLRANQYGASFKFRIMREEIVNDAKASAHNPKGLDERTIKECQVFEFGPVTFGAYSDATAGLRSLTDDYILDGLAHADPELVRMAANGVDLAGLIAHRAGRNRTSVSFSGGTSEEGGTTVGETTTNDGGEEVRATVRESDPGCPVAMPFGVVDASGALVACHATDEAARAQADALPTITREVAAETASTEDESRDDAASDTNGDGGTGDGAVEVGTADEREESGTATGEAATENDNEETAAPGDRPTPLVGPLGYRESWRL